MGTHCYLNQDVVDSVALTSSEKITGILCKALGLPRGKETTIKCIIKSHIVDAIDLASLKSHDE